MKNTNKKLMQYSALAAAYVLFPDKTNAQVVYMDINPDTILDTQYEPVGIDFDGDSLDDFIFIRTTFERTEDGTRDSQVELLLAGAFDSINNGIAASNVYVFGSSGGGYFLNYPYAFADGKTISPALNFENDNFQTLAYFKYSLYGEGFNNGNANWENFSLDKYLGIKFIDQDNQRHYGWIRCDVNEHMHRIVIKDYAYEQQPDHPIIAGSIESFVVATSPQINTLQASIYNFGNTIFIKTANPNAQQITIKITDITGKQMYTEQDVFSTKKITLNVPHGIYFVSVIIGEESTVAKVYL